MWDKIVCCRLKRLGMLWSVAFTSIVLHAQENVDHWEAAVLDGTSWHYLVPMEQPAAAWATTGFNDSFWPEGPSGFGYGDGDDATVVSSTSSLYLRHIFLVENLESWIDVDFLMDYDDGFIAYLNGTEIARGNAGQTGDFIAWNQNLATDHEAVLYAGGIPPSFEFDFAPLLVEGSNTLAIELHNVNPTSSDLTARPYLMVGTTANGLGFDAPPSWFAPASGDMHDVTFNLNMADEVVASSGVFVAGGNFFGVAGDHPMTDSDGDDIWTADHPGSIRIHRLLYVSQWPLLGLELQGKHSRPGVRSPRKLQRPNARQRCGSDLGQHLFWSVLHGWPVRCGDRVHGCGSTQLFPCGDRG